jgi:hypothetical protein
MAERKALERLPTMAVGGGPMMHPAGVAPMGVPIMPGMQPIMMAPQPSVYPMLAAGHPGGPPQLVAAPSMMISPCMSPLSVAIHALCVIHMTHVCLLCGIAGIFPLGGAPPVVQAPDPYYQQQAALAEQKRQLDAQMAQLAMAQQAFAAQQAAAVPSPPHHAPPHHMMASYPSGSPPGYPGPSAPPQSPTEI